MTGRRRRPAASHSTGFRTENGSGQISVHGYCFCGSGPHFLPLPAHHKDERNGILKGGLRVNPGVFPSGLRLHCHWNVYIVHDREPDYRGGGNLRVILLLLLWPSLVNFLPTSASGSLVGFLLLWTLCVVVIHRVTSHNLLAFVLEAAGIVALVGAYVAKKSMFDRALVNLVEKIAVTDVFQNFANNYIFDAGGLIYYASIIFLLVFLTVQSVEKRRWS